MAGLTVEQARRLFLAVAGQMILSQEMLTEADRVIGDGDHGTGMARGFTAVRHMLEQSAPADLGELLRQIGRELMKNIGGAAGIIFGTLFQAGGKNLAGVQVLDTRALHTWLVDGLAGVQARGKASAGDKTMVDALLPAALAAAENLDRPLADSLAAVSQAALAGMEATRDMVANFGKAKTLGERALGHPDPGALSTYLILKTMAEEVQVFPPG